MKIVEIRTEAELQALQPAWDALLETSASNTIFLTWEWVTAWWSAYGKAGDLRILTAWDDAGKLRGIAPMRQTKISRFGATAEALSFIGDGSNDSEYLDVIIAMGCEDEVTAAFQRHWSPVLEGGRILLLGETPSSSVNLPWFRSLRAESETLTVENPVPCATVHLPDTWKAYVETLKPRFRTNVRSVLRNLENQPEARFGICQTEQDLERMLPILFDLHKRRWSQVGKPGVFGWKAKQEFYFDLSKRLLQRGWLRFSWLAWNDTVLACQYGFLYRGTYFHLQEGFEPASEHRNSGIGLRAWSIREFLNEGVKEYDFLGGMSRHKSDWGAEVKYSTNLQVARASYKNLLLCRGPEWNEKIRESVKKAIPEKILTLRKTLLERKKASPNGEVESSAADWLRQSAATFYFNLRLPALARPLRDQYQLSAGSGGGARRLTKRNEAVGRILYYHRVNDDNDPFFPAISTKLFEQEMRYVARHYQVVPLGAMLSHLENGSNKPVMAITFDDGYQDNYSNALPILRRYGLPATIFLTTGSLDTRQPLWFEQLADALKRTTRERVDVEIDIPRRFVLDSEAARLKANGDIFALLRKLDDSARAEWFQRVLERLDVSPDPARQGKMLTWDQVREMNQYGISFGGHTVTHPFMSKVTRDQASWEVSESKRRIEEELQMAVDHFAYPNGREEDFGEWSKDVLLAAGYKAAVTTKWGLNYASTDRMELRRGGPWETNPALFAYKLDWYQLVND